jgi:hypothetical protein
MTKNLLTVIAIIEFGTGLVLVTLPSLLTRLLFGLLLDTLVSFTVARVAGVAIVALSVACWLARNDGQSRAARGLLSAMVLYNIAIVIVLVYTALGLLLSGIGLWPVVLLHIAMSVWCIMILVSKPLQKIG